MAVLEIYLCAFYRKKLNVKAFVYSDSILFLNLFFILNRHWRTPVFVVYPALHLDLLVQWIVLDINVTLRSGVT